MIHLKARIERAFCVRTSMAMFRLAGNDSESSNNTRKDWELVVKYDMRILFAAES